MTTHAGDDLKKEAFRLFEEGMYQESLQTCTALSAADRDAAVDVLTATNLYYTGKHEDAEVCFRDLLQVFPVFRYLLKHPLLPAAFFFHFLQLYQELPNQGVFLTGCFCLLPFCTDRLNLMLQNGPRPVEPLVSVPAE